MNFLIDKFVTRVTQTFIIIARHLKLWRLKNESVLYSLKSPKIRFHNEFIDT